MAAIVFAGAFILFLTLWMRSNLAFKMLRSESKADKEYIKQLQSEISKAQKEFEELKTLIQKNEDNRPAIDDNRNVPLDSLIRKMQQRFDGAVRSR